MIRTPQQGRKRGNFIRAVMDPTPIKTGESSISFEIEEKLHRRKSEKEMDVLPNGRVRVGPGLYQLGIVADVTARNLQPINDWRVQLYLVNIETDLAVGTMQLTQLGSFTKVVGLEGPGTYELRPYSVTGQVKRLTLPNREIQNDISLENITIEISRVDIPESEDEVKAPTRETRVVVR